MTDAPTTGAPQPVNPKKRAALIAIILALALALGGGMWGIKASLARAEAAAEAELIAEAERQAQERDLALVRESAQEVLAREEVSDVHALVSYLEEDPGYVRFESLQEELEEGLREHTTYSMQGVHALRDGAQEFGDLTDELFNKGMDGLWAEMLESREVALRLWNTTYTEIDPDSHEELRKVVAGSPREFRDKTLSREQIEEKLQEYRTATTKAHAAHEAWLEENEAQTSTASESRDSSTETVAPSRGSTSTPVPARTTPPPAPPAPSKPAPPAPAKPKPTQTPKPAPTAKPTPKPTPKPTQTPKPPPTPKPTPTPDRGPSALDQARIALQYATASYAPGSCFALGYQEGDGGWSPAMWAKARASEGPTAFVVSGNASWARVTAYACD